MQEKQKTQVQSLSLKDFLEEEMAAHSTILAQKIPWTEKPGRLQATESQSQTQLNTHTHMHSQASIFTVHYYINLNHCNISLDVASIHCDTVNKANNF